MGQNQWKPKGEEMWTQMQEQSSSPTKRRREEWRFGPKSEKPKCQVKRKNKPSQNIQPKSKRNGPRGSEPEFRAENFNEQALKIFEFKFQNSEPIAAIKVNY